jgi:hypothetical protein
MQVEALQFGDAQCATAALHGSLAHTAQLIDEIAPFNRKCDARSARCRAQSDFDYSRMT